MTNSLTTPGTPGPADTETPAEPPRPGGSVRSLMRALLWMSPAAIVYLVLTPLAALRLDGWFALPALPAWSRWLALLLLPVGLGIAAWTIWLFAVIGHGTPNPMSPPRDLVTQGPYRYSRNPMMLALWALGLGVALALGSPSLLAAILLIAGAGAGYVRLIEEPALRRRFGESYRRLEAETPRWLGLSATCSKR